MKRLNLTSLAAIAAMLHQPTIANADTIQPGQIIPLTPLARCDRMFSAKPVPQRLNQRQRRKRWRITPGIRPARNCTK